MNKNISRASDNPMYMNAGLVQKGDRIILIDRGMSLYEDVATEDGYYTVPNTTVLAYVNGKLTIDLLGQY